MDVMESQSNKTNWQSNADDTEIQNGTNRRQMVIGPPSNYLGPRPPISCELYITNLPTSLDVMGFLNWLNRLGAVFEIRIMMSTVNETRGFCFVRFFEKKSADAAFELLSFLFLNGKRPNPQISQCKRQLFVCGIPKQLSITHVRDTFKKLFGTVTKCVVYPQIGCSNGWLNRGFAFLEFNEHDAAIEGKRFLRSHRIWGQTIKVDWAKKIESKENITLPLKICNGIPQRKNDYSAKLRLYAIANNWDIPIIVFGSNFREHHVQYGGVLIKDSNNAKYSCVVVEVICPIYDIHILLCEIVTHLAEVYCGLPEKHFFVRSRCGSIAKILHSFTDINQLNETNSTPSSLLSASSAFDLMYSLVMLAQFQSDNILKCYKLSFRSDESVNENIARFALINNEKLSHFFSIYPKYRENYALNNNFNDTEIVLLQAEAMSYVNACVTPEEFNALLNVKTPDEGAFELKSQRYNRHPKYVLNFVDIQSLRTCAFYNYSQQFNTPPLWVCGETYQDSIFELS